MKVLDLFCGGGGASVGIKRAGVRLVVGVDIGPMPEYPFPFLQCDVFDLPVKYLRQFDFIWASPPCQAYAWASKQWASHGLYRDLVSETRELLIKTGKPFVIENVCTAPIRNDLVLDGTMFGLRVIRRRAFELGGFFILAPDGIKDGSVGKGDYVTVAGHGGDGKFSLGLWQKAMEIDWITERKKLVEAVPPAYSKYILEQFLAQIEV